MQADVEALQTEKAWLKARLQAMESKAHEMACENLEIQQTASQRLSAIHTAQGSSTALQRRVQALNEHISCLEAEVAQVCVFARAQPSI